MPTKTNARIVDVTINLEPVPFRMPLKFGGRVVDQTQLINATATLEGTDGSTAIGFGSMPVGNIWAWPSAVVDATTAESAMIKFSQTVANTAGTLGDSAHPVELMWKLMGTYTELAEQVASESQLPEPLPKLAQLVAASPIDAAVHDAYGKLHSQSSYNVLSAEHLEPDLSEFLGPDFAHERLDQYTSRQPKPTMPLYHLVGAIDPLTRSEIEKPVNDNLPESLDEWIVADGLTHLKIKLSGDDLDWDVERVLAIDRISSEVQQQRGCSEWHYSCDFNEKCENVEYVLDFLNRIRETTPAAYDRIQYLEQPTNRNLKAFPENKMHRATELKPVVIDESLVDLETFHLAIEQGYSGVALKACKGHTESLLFAAAAQKMGLFLCVQDLTCPGYSFLHSASLAARFPTVAAIEGNGRQYCPAPNAKWSPQYPGMFEITDGTVHTAELNGEGLFGSHLV
ncbi:enolase C-terminal domain-like protein [Calycomorphotria hydatis]|uniref:Enolase C-terminal domain-containing protein n=1 Tax=Calycomorphotria hydatis TaxID=2528027 RepID=A0A517TAA9_9PLAN|nr:enolase C-terminal domain-like protein [Calycomorphotria hydatis]QDT65311.1 hypothetical protein V22_25600 [Calycomorphotria hydatis]